MKFFIPLTLLVGALASPLERRQTANDFVQGGCKGVMMAYARGSTELGNVGTLGPSLESGLSKNFDGDFAMQGVEYPAAFMDNYLANGTNKKAMKTMADLLTDMATRCPEARIVAGGYSQGSAVAASAVQQMSREAVARIDAMVFFGYTRQLQNKGAVPNFPQEKLKIFCNVGDMVCSGTLIITATHLTYSLVVPDAVDFITQKVKAAQAAGN